jgi:hypothetical protein
VHTDYVESYASAKFHPKICHIMACRKNTNHMSVTRDTIHISLFFFAQATYGYILIRNFTYTQDTT